MFFTKIGNEKQSACPPIGAGALDVDDAKCTGRNFFDPASPRGGGGLSVDVAHIVLACLDVDDVCVARGASRRLHRLASRRLARLMGGDILAHSAPGSGSTFSVTIDPGPLAGVLLLEPQEALAVTRQATGDASGRWRFPPARVLVVDDGEENRELIQLLLGEVGLAVEGAENGRVGVDQARTGRFDVVLMDMRISPYI